MADGSGAGAGSRYVEASPELLDSVALEHLAAPAFQVQGRTPQVKIDIRVSGFAPVGFSGSRNPEDAAAGGPVARPVTGAEPRGPVVPGPSRRHDREDSVGRPRRSPPHESPYSNIPPDHLLSLRRFDIAGPSSRAGPVRHSDGVSGPVRWAAS